MTQEVKQRIEQIRRGEVPEGYVKTRAGVMPLDWEVNVPAKAVFKNHSDKKHNGQFEVLSATQDRGIIPRNEVDIDIKYDEGGIDSYKKVEKGDFVISLRSFQGGIEYSEYDGLVSPAYTVLKAKKPIYPGYYRAYFKTVDFINRLNGAVYGIRDGKQIGYEDFGDLIIHYPPLEEQKKIAQVLDACDRVIELKQKLLDEMKKLKKVCLEKMFPQKESSVPEIRFPGFTAPWEQRKLGDAACVIGGNAWKSTDYSDSGEYLVVTIANVSGDVFINDAVGNHLSCDNPEGYLLDENDILVSLTGNVGRVSKMTRIQGLLNQRVGKIVPNSSDVNAGFLFHVLRNPCFEKAMIDAGQGAAQKNISNSDVLNYSFLLPVDKDEQASIACYFDELDNLITLHQRELEAEQQKKKALMQLLLTGIVRTV